MKKRKTNRAKKVDKTCRNHGSCPYCQQNRLYQVRKEKLKADYQEDENDSKFQREIRSIDTEW